MTNRRLNGQYPVDGESNRLTMWQTVSARIRGKVCAHYTAMCRPPYEDNIKVA